MTQLTTNQVLNQLKSELERALEDASQSAATVQLDQNAVGRLSRMDAMQQQNMALANQRSISTRLAKTHKALVALEAGDYGFCEECGEEINSGRLELYPETDLCLSCQSNKE
ncbi:MAG: TraR/DksA family transcriptional regulator [Porticoccaceae bacterium]|jgi:DnaK suppressor protein|nr:TraR/DksA family transcriptional regulator [Porticoccaceae bacterium]